VKGADGDIVTAPGRIVSAEVGEMQMKGVVLAGGLGTRLLPLTKVTNKHLLPVYDRPMVFYPIGTLAAAGVRELLVVTGGNNADDFERLLEDGSDLGLDEINYAYQEGHGGIADALRLARDFVGGDKFVAMLGDNIIQGNIIEAARAFQMQAQGARIILKEVSDPGRFGVAEIESGRIVSIEEKPTQPKSRYAVIGIYFYHPDVFDVIATLKPSARNELEITDVNNAYATRGNLAYNVLEGWWTDAGTSFEALLRANRRVADTGANNVDL